MHTSGMRTARLLTVSQPALAAGVGCACQGVYLPRGCTCLGVYLPRGCTCQGVPAQILPTVNRMTDRQV